MGRHPKTFTRERSFRALGIIDMISYVDASDGKDYVRPLEMTESFYTPSSSIWKH
jgi:hypothetical protein